jgi:hypothetical protein
MSRTFYCFARTGMVALALLLAGSASTLAQVRVTGVVTDVDTGEPLPGANVVVLGTTMGSATDVEGRYVIDGVPAGTLTLEASFVGFETLRRVVSVRGTETRVDFTLTFSNQAMEALEVFASRAVERRTPVAYSNLDKVQVQRELGSRDVPMVLNTTPSVYASQSGGGAGDARINVRGFNQRNVAIMINGVPVNDMENGWVYWSNWDGVGDATSSIQLQRGLSAVNLATPSIGGTMNILTDPAAIGRMARIKQEMGNDGFLKTSVFANTGLMGNKFAVSVAGVRKTGDGYYDGTWTDAWAYYGAVSFQVNAKHRLDLFAVGAPQRHGQNLYMQNLMAYDADFAAEVFEDDGLGQGTIDGARTKFWDDKSYRGRRWNENVSAVSSDYTLEQNNGFGIVERPGTCTIAGEEVSCINERENFFHKPQVNLNWYAQFSPKLLLSTVLYYSGGKGGGTGTFGSMVWDYTGPSRVVDYDATIARNAANATGSRGILRNSHNVQDTWGAISKLKINVNEALTAEVGLDWRTAEIRHYRTVRDLLGGEYYQTQDSDFWDGPQQLQGGDVFNYDNTNTVDWIGGFAQAEYVKDNLSLYGMTGVSTIKYTFVDDFVDAGDGTPRTVETDNIAGYQVKGGGLYNVGEELDVYANAGWVSKVPIFDGVIDDVTGTLNTDPKNEEFVSVEAGLMYRSRTMPLSVAANVYRTTWKNRTIARGVTLADGTEGIVNLLGLDALHQGVEVEAAYQPLPFLRFDGAASLGDWTYTEDVSARYVPDGREPNLVEQLRLYTRDLRVGDAPQTQFALGVSLYPVDGLYMKLLGRHYMDFYAEFDPLSRTVEGDRTQSWQIPAYTVFDLHAGYNLPIKSPRYDVQVFANVFNLLDEVYVLEAVDNSSFNAYTANGVNHRADDAEVFLGLPTTFNLGLTVTFR